MNENSMLDLLPSNAYPEKIEGAQLVSGNMISPDIDEDEMEVLFNLVKDRINLNKVSNEDNDEENKENVENKTIDEDKDEDINNESIEIDNIFRGSCIYKLDNYTFPYRIKEVSLENLYVGNLDGRLELFSPSDLPHNSNLIEMYWTCVELADGSIHIMLDNVETVIEDELTLQENIFH